MSRGRTACGRASWAMGSAKGRRAFRLCRNAERAARVAAGAASGIDLDPAEISFFVGRANIKSTTRPGMARWRERLYAGLARIATRPTGVLPRAGGSGHRTRRRDRYLTVRRRRQWMLPLPLHRMDMGAERGGDHAPLDKTGQK